MQLLVMEYFIIIFGAPDFYLKPNVCNRFFFVGPHFGSAIRFIPFLAGRVKRILEWLLCFRLASCTISTDIYWGMSDGVSAASLFEPGN